MKRFRLVTWATLMGVVLTTGCASPCGGCRSGFFQRMSMFRARGACPCECCSSCEGGVPIVGAGQDFSDGPMLEPAGPPMSAVPPPAGMAVPGMSQPSLGAPLGMPAMPTDPTRVSPVPDGAQPFSAGPSSRVRSR